MPLSKIFWMLVVVNFLFVIVYLAGFDILPAIILLLIINIMLLEINRHIDKKVHMAEFSDSIHTRINNIERIITHVVNRPAHTDIESHKSELRQEFNDSMDRLAKKAIDIENKLNDLRRTVGAIAAVFEDRMAEVEQDNI